MLSILILHKRSILITGEFNFHVDNCCRKPAISFLDTCSTFGLAKHVRDRTHRNSYTLDLVLSSDASVVDIQVCPLTLSDHYFISFQTIGAILPKPNTYITWRRDIRSINKSDLLLSLKDSVLIYLIPCTKSN